MLGQLIICSNYINCDNIMQTNMNKQHNVNTASLLLAYHHASGHGSHQAVLRNPQQRRRGSDTLLDSDVVRGVAALPVRRAEELQ